MSDIDRDTERQQPEGTGYESSDPGRRRRALEAYGGARDSLAGAGRRATEALDESPLIALAGGLAAGALIAALLPRTRAEKDLLRPIGKRVNQTARSAAQAARQAGVDRLDELGLTPDKARETIRSLFEGAGDAARASAQAAAGTVRGDRR